MSAGDQGIACGAVMVRMHSAFADDGTNDSVHGAVLSRVARRNLSASILRFVEYQSWNSASPMLL